MATTTTTKMHLIVHRARLVGCIRCTYSKQLALYSSLWATTRVLNRLFLWFNDCTGSHSSLQTIMLCLIGNSFRFQTVNQIAFIYCDKVDNILGGISPQIKCSGTSSSKSTSVFWTDSRLKSVIFSRHRHCFLSTSQFFQFVAFTHLGKYERSMLFFFL